MSISVNTISISENPNFDVVFLHGLNGDQVGTWTHETGGLWPGWLTTTFPGAGIHLIGYDASIFAKAEKVESNLHERAEAILQNFILDGIGTRPLALICHSLGGITAKEILRIAAESANEEWNAVFHQTRLVVFLATPHTGAALARIAKLLIPRVSSTHLDLLSDRSGYLAALQKSYSELVERSAIRTEAFYEKNKTGRGVASVLVVEEASANPGVAGCRPTALHDNHIDLVKFPNTQAFGYRLIVRMLEKTFGALASQSCSGAFALNGFSDQHASDRRDLLEKLTDAGRQHEYDKANERQNAFALRYTQLGLHEEARVESDKVLAEVEQRFTTHVYHGKICKHASDDEIMDCIQEKVIDPICSKYGENGNVNAISVQEALYYLTQKCYIKWDYQK